MSFKPLTTKEHVHLYSGRFLRGRLAEIVLFLLCAYGFYLAFRTGAPDFKVFVYAGDLVLKNRILDIYSESPDRFLYAPGAAVLFSLFALIPYSLSLFLWTCLKVWGLFSLVSRLKEKFTSATIAIALILIARPLFIDFRYGNLNSFLLILGMHFVLDLTDSEQAKPRGPALSKRMSYPASVRTFFFGAFAFLKLIFLSIGVLPVLRKRWPTLLLFALGIFWIFLLPLIPWFSGGENDFRTYFLKIHGNWIEALKMKGLPIETPNQSMIAFLTRIFGGATTYSLFMGGVGLDLGWKVLSPESIQWIFRLYIVGIFSLWLFLFSTFSKVRHGDSATLWKEGFLFLGILWLPSHLIWKPYFLLGLPIILLSVQWLLMKRQYGVIAILIFMTGFTGLDLLGPIPATHLEAWSLQLFIYFFSVMISFHAVRKKFNDPSAKV